jgi:hypothetical protein
VVTVLEMRIRVVGSAREPERAHRVPDADAVDLAGSQSELVAGVVESSLEHLSPVECVELVRALDVYGLQRLANAARSLLLRGCDESDLVDEVREAPHRERTAAETEQRDAVARLPLSRQPVVAVAHVLPEARAERLAADVCTKAADSFVVEALVAVHVLQRVVELADVRVRLLRVAGAVGADDQVLGHVAIVWDP